MIYKVQIWYKRWLPDLCIWGEVEKTEYRTDFPDPTEFINAPATKAILFFNFINV